MKILAVTVTYFPDKDLLKRLIESYANLVESILVWENTPKESSQRYRLPGDLKYSQKIEYVGEGMNSGISHALNFALDAASKGGFDYLLTMDQDSVWEGFNRFLSHIKEESRLFPDIYSPKYKGRSQDDVFVKTNALITSGMLVPVEAILRIGGYCEQFKIDTIDTELSCRAERYGINRYLVRDCWLHHQLGHPTIKHFLGKRYTITDYPTSRLFEIYRNSIITIRYHKECKWVKQDFINNWIKKVPILILLGANKRFRKLWSIVNGICAGYRFNLKNFRDGQS
jgi:rhamnosyltransferase